MNTLNYKDTEIFEILAMNNSKEARSVDFRVRPKISTEAKEDIIHEGYLYVIELEKMGVPNNE
uniref:Uncharacterized protein n=1 Tax=Oryza brachyantha TaxID=4533 RepID=J3L2U2_ORYBR